MPRLAASPILVPTATPIMTAAAVPATAAVNLMPSIATLMTLAFISEISLQGTLETSLLNTQ